MELMIPACGGGTFDGCGCSARPVVLKLWLLCTAEGSNLEAAGVGCLWITPAERAAASTTCRWSLCDEPRNASKYKF